MPDEKLLAECDLLIRVVSATKDEYYKDDSALAHVQLMAKFDRTYRARVADFFTSAGPYIPDDGPGMHVTERIGNMVRSWSDADTFAQNPSTYESFGTYLAGVLKYLEAYRPYLA